MFDLQCILRDMGSLALREVTNWSVKGKLQLHNHTYSSRL